MTIKLKDVAVTYNLKNAEQIGSNQLFKGYSDIYKTDVYVSYNTIIAVRTNMQWYVTAERFSRTTTNHKSVIGNSHNCIVTVSKEFFDSTLQGLRVNNLLK